MLGKLEVAVNPDSEFLSLFARTKARPILIRNETDYYYWYCAYYMNDYMTSDTTNIRIKNQEILLPTYKRTRPYLGSNLVLSQ